MSKILVNFIPNSKPIAVVHFPSHVDSLMYHQIMHFIRNGDCSYIVKFVIADWINGYVK